MRYLVVDVAVGEHGVEVLHALASAAVVVVLQPPLNGAHVHGDLDDLMVVLGEGTPLFKKVHHPPTLFYMYTIGSINHLPTWMLHGLVSVTSKGSTI